ncbi:MAG: hypothetical protein AAF543_01350 [Pseudomonadota bacterium]
MITQHWLALAGASGVFLALGAMTSPFVEPHLTPGERTSAFRAIACNTAEQVADILGAFSESYEIGREAFARYHEQWEYDAAMAAMAPACDDVWFESVVPVQAVAGQVYDVHLADGSLHRRYVVEVRPVHPKGNTVEASYFISSEKPVTALETDL